MKDNKLVKDTYNYKCNNGGYYEENEKLKSLEKVFSCDVYHKQDLDELRNLVKIVNDEELIMFLKKINISNDELITLE